MLLLNFSMVWKERMVGGRAFHNEEAFQKKRGLVTLICIQKVFLWFNYRFSNVNNLGILLEFIPLSHFHDSHLWDLL